MRGSNSITVTADDIRPKNDPGTLVDLAGRMEIEARTAIQHGLLKDLGADGFGATEDTIVSDPNDQPEPEDPATLQEAFLHWQQGYVLHISGNYHEAIASFRRSIEAYPTAEGHTFLGWSLSHLGRVDEAIAECKKAIAVDPDYGNPYNDIGAYLIELGKADEAVPWLEKAMGAKRYCCYEYPHANGDRPLPRWLCLQAPPPRAGTPRTAKPPRQGAWRCGHGLKRTREMDSAVGCRSREAPDGTSSRPKTLARSRVARLRVEGENGLGAPVSGRSLRSARQIASAAIQ